jgi:hypothetical protein
VTNETIVKSEVTPEKVKRLIREIDDLILSNEEVIQRAYGEITSLMRKRIELEALAIRAWGADKFSELFTDEVGALPGRERPDET